MNLVKYCDESGSRQEMAPLIDVVFLLLIYFMVSATLIKPEGDLRFTIPAGDPVALPVEAYVQIDGDGTVVLDGIKYDAVDRDLDRLASQIFRLDQLSRVQQSDFVVTLDPDDAVSHARIVDVMDACAMVDIRNIAFARNGS